MIFPCVSGASPLFMNQLPVPWRRLHSCETQCSPASKKPFSRQDPARILPATRGPQIGGNRISRHELFARSSQFRTFPFKVTRGLHPTPPSNPGWLTGLTKNGHVPKGTCGLMDIQHPAVLDDHPVVSAQSQLSTCGGARP